MCTVDNEYLIHYGIPKRSGRYPWGSGDSPYQHSGDFLSRIDELKKQGMSETDIAKSFNLSTTQLRTQESLAKAERREILVQTAQGLREKGYSLNEIAEQMGYANDSSVRSLLNENSKSRMMEAEKTAIFLKQMVDEKGMIDVGKGVEYSLNVSAEKLKQALYIMELDGYPTYSGRMPQVTNSGKLTTLKVLCPPGTQHKEIFNYENIHSTKEYISHDGGDTFDTFIYPKSMDSSRLQICYAEDGGINKDGTIEIRRNVDDLDLGGSHYAQVRILVDDNKYLKGMAVYSDNMPDGVDVIFNTNKTSSVSKNDVMKSITEDPDNPFGSLIKAGGQSYYIDDNGDKQLSLINKRAEEGDWTEWSNKLPSQFLAKQSMTLINKQLSLAAADKQAEYDEILSCLNPTVKKALLQSYSDDCDSASVHLKAAALPGQQYKVILPITSLKDTEVYAPDYANGTQVALVRYPHGGTFEIPILTVNNKQAESKKTLGNAIDAIGINSKVAERLSGADFDGDTVMIIPTNSSVKITSTQSLQGLEGFDPKMEYPYKEGMKLMKNSTTGSDSTQVEMGKISNLITDMTLKGATQDELARAVRHSMVVIDAGKHKLNYTQSYSDNGIASLKKKYQGTVDADGSYHESAATLISRAKSQTSVIKRRGSPTIDPDTGEYIWKETLSPTYVDSKTGKTITKTQKSTEMAETKDAYLLSSGTMQEDAYASYANKMKAMANDARKELLITANIPYSPSAKKTYQLEYDSLSAKLNVAKQNAPKERQAQIIANTIVTAKKQSYPDMTKKEIKKVSQQAITYARNSVGAKRELIDISDSEWEAIQAGAISPNKLSEIITYSDIDTIKQLAMPKTTTTLSQAKINKISAMTASGYTIAEIAESLVVSSTTVTKYL